MCKTERWVTILGTKYVELKKHDNFTQASQLASVRKSALQWAVDSVLTYKQIPDKKTLVKVGILVKITAWSLKPA